MFKYLHHIFKVHVVYSVSLHIAVNCLPITNREDPYRSIDLSLHTTELLWVFSNGVVATRVNKRPLNDIVNWRALTVHHNKHVLLDTDYSYYI